MSVGIAKASHHLAFIALVYCAINAPWIVDGDVLMAWDNLGYHLPNFAYIAGSIRHGFGIPVWYADFGGEPLGISSVSLFPLLPHRLIGYAAYAFLPIHLVVAYKLSLMSGMLISAVGWWLVFRRLSGSLFGSTVGCLMLLLGGTGLTALHQEQGVVTALWMPYTLLGLMSAYRDVRYLPIAGAMLGASISTHYPHIQVLALMFVMVAGLTVGEGLGPLKAALKRPAYILFAALTFCLALSPLLYPMAGIGDYRSPIRTGEALGAGTLNEYLELNAQQKSAVMPAMLWTYVHPAGTGGPGFDRWVFYVTYIGLGCALAGVFSGTGAAAGALIVLVLSVWAGFGIAAYMPQVLFALKFPYIGYFRQWYHFAPVMNASLALLAAIGVGWMLKRADTFGLHGGRRMILIALVLGLIALDAHMYRTRYLGSGLHRAALERADLSVAEYLNLLKGWGFRINFSQRLGFDSMYPVLVHGDWAAMPRECYQLASGPPFTVGLVLDDTEMAAEGRAGYLNGLCDKGHLDSVVSATMGVRSESYPFEIRAGLASGQIEAGSVVNAKLGESEYSVTPRGFSAHSYAFVDTMLVAPYAYGLGLEATVNGAPARTYPVNGGGMTGVIVPRGRYEVVMVPGRGWYEYAQSVQYVMLMGVALYAYGLRRRKAGER